MGAGGNVTACENAGGVVGAGGNAPALGGANEGSVGGRLAGDCGNAGGAKGAGAGLAVFAGGSVGATLFVAGALVDGNGPAGMAGIAGGANEPSRDGTDGTDGMVGIEEAAGGKLLVLVALVDGAARVGVVAVVVSGLPAGTEPLGVLTV